MDFFYELDARLDKKWVFNTWMLTAYLDVTNLTNKNNPAALVYNYDYTQQGKISGLPILPTFGIKGEF